MSFTQIVKEEILHKEITKQREKDMEIYAVLKTKKTIYQDRIEIKLENLLLAKRLYTYLKENTKLKFIFKYSISKRFGEHKVFVITIPKQAELKKLLEMLEILDKADILKSEIKLKGYIRGMFLACGYIKEPTKEYAMDFFIENSTQAEKLCNVLEAIGKRVFCANKKNKYLVYLRNSEDIMDVLIMLGAKHAFFQYEEVTVVKDIKNKTIRSMNWEVANETKLLNTATKHVVMIEYIINSGHFDELTKPLQEAAEIRLEYPESSLLELAELSGITKSGIRNRFRRIENIYKKLTEEE